MSNQNGAGPTTEDKTRFESTKAELVQALSVKRALDKQLAQLELQIYNLETTYLTDTASHSGGNIIQGFDGYLKNQSIGRRKYEVSDADRIFSNSSLTYQKSLDLMADAEDSTATATTMGTTITAVDESMMKQQSATPGLTTVVVPAATRTQELTAAQQKKHRDREYQRKKRANASRRSTGTISDDDQLSTGRRPTKRARLADDD